MIASFAETATLIGFATALELVEESEQMCGGAEVFVRWVLERDGDDPALVALAAGVEMLAAEALAAVTMTREAAA